MKISLHWLADYLPGPLDAQAAADALMRGGLPIESIEHQGEDAILDVEVTSNRGDCLSHLGIARELSALLNRPLKDVIPAAAESPQAAVDGVSVRIEAPDLCPHYTARIIRGVKIGPSPDWMIHRLQAVGLRPINNVVDVTNYVMFEMGQPLHAFDFAKIGGQQIIVRTAKAGEKIASIDGHERALAAGMLVIADAKNPLALAGVMGGLQSEVSGVTSDILLESARFDPLSVRKTARALMMRSDSSYRFERGIDPLLPIKASLRAAQLILQTSGGTPLTPAVEASSNGWTAKTLSLRLSRLKEVLGISIPTEQVADALRRLHLSPVVSGEKIAVTVPSYRLDLNQEIDLVEEVARIVGYDQIPVREEISIRLTPPDPTARVMETIRQTLVAAGYFEAITFSFVSDGLKDDFVHAPSVQAQSTVRKADATLRQSLLPGLLESVRHNESVGNNDARLFEMGATFCGTGGGRVEETTRLALVGSDDFREVRGVVESLLNRLDPDRPIKFSPVHQAGLNSKAAAAIHWGDQPIGSIGLVNDAVVGKLSLRRSPAAAELSLVVLLDGARSIPKLRPLPRFPAVRRDLSLVIAETIQYEKIESTIRAAQPENLEEIEYVTTYRGKPLESGSKSVTVTLVFQSASATLTGELVELSVQKIVVALRERLNSVLRV